MRFSIAASALVLLSLQCVSGLSYDVTTANDLVSMVANAQDGDEFVLEDGVHLVGDSVVINAPNVILRAANDNMAVIDMGGNRATTDSYGVVTVASGVEGVHIKGLNITGHGAGEPYAAGTVYGEGGGLVLRSSSKALVEDCNIYDNRCNQYYCSGGLKVWYHAEAVLNRLKIHDNYCHGSYGEGGGVGFDGAKKVEMNDCKIFNNRASGDRGGSGGINVQSGSHTETIIRDTDIYSNTAKNGYGAGVGFYGSHGTHTLINCNIYDNVILGGEGGGALGVYWTPVTLIGCNLHGNSGRTGGAIYLHPLPGGDKLALIDTIVGDNYDLETPPNVDNFWFAAPVCISGTTDVTGWLGNSDGDVSSCEAPPPSPPADPGMSWSYGQMIEPTSSVSGDPHLHLAHGGVADFRGVNGSHYALLSAPGIQFAAMTLDTDFLLPRPQLVHGSFFTNVTWTLRGAALFPSVSITSDANSPGFTVIDGTDGTIVASEVGTWQEWIEDGVYALFKQSTLVVRANGWEVSATRRPIYNHVAGPSKWRFDIAMRPLDGTTGLEAEHGTASKTCYPHGIIGQSWDGDDIAVDGATDDYTFKPEDPVITTKAMAEGAIEGKPADYELAAGEETGSFAYSRFDKTADAICAPRDVSKLAGKKTARAQSAAAAGSNDEPLAA